MCFTPKVSIITAIIEFIMVGWILIKFKKLAAIKLVAILVFILGFYQFTEYMLCTSGNINLWARAGFVTYNFLPAIGLHFVLKFTKSNFKIWPIYIPTMIFAAIALFVPNFVIYGECSKVFVTILTLFYQLPDNLLLFSIYMLYYFGYVGIIIHIMLKQYKVEQDKIRKKISLLWLLAILIPTIPAFILFAIFPSMRLMFPSVYCQFALLCAVIIFMAASLENKHQTQ